MRLFQFWDANPPDDVAGFMDAARDVATAARFDYVRLDARSGRAFVAEHYGARGLAVWDACALPVMWSDYLRLLLMDMYGGIYADASYEFPGDLRAFVASAPVAQIPFWMTIVNGNYLMFREPGNLFVRACIALLTENVERRRMGSPVIAVGPGVLNAVRCVVSPEDRAGIDKVARDSGSWVPWGWEEGLAAAERLIDPTADLVAAYRSITLVPTDELHRYAISRFDTEHRRRPDYWFKWTGSIYR